jgi:hypothetical protein
MPNNSKSPNKFFGSIAGAAAGAARSGALNAAIDKVGIFGGKAFQAARSRKLSARKAAIARQVPSVVQTAGASNMSGRIESIESRLSTLEGSGAAGAANQPVAEVAPSETQAGAAASQAMAADQTGNAVSGIGGIGIPVPPPAPAASASVLGGAIAGAVQPQLPASEALGSLMASPFTMRQRANMGPLMFKDQTGDGKITRADVIKARVEGYKK